MQVMLGVLTISFAGMWLRAVHRVRRSVLQRCSMLQRLAKRVALMDTDTLVCTINGLVQLQATFRRRRSALRVARLSAMEAYEFSDPARKQLLWLVNGLVALYIGCCLYAIALYGTWTGRCER